MPRPLLWSALLSSLVLLPVPHAAAGYVEPVYVSTFGRSSGDTPADLGLNRGIGVDSGSGDVYVTDDKLRRFDSAGNLLAEWDCPNCHGIDANTITHDIYVCHRNEHKVVQYTRDGAVVRAWGSFGEGDDQFSHPVDLAVDTANGEIFVVDGFAVRVFDLDGNFLRRWGSVGEGLDEFTGRNGIYQIAYDATSGTVWTADSHGDRLSAWDRDGNFLRGHDGNDNGTGFGDYRWARGLDVDENGNPYIADADGERVTGYSPLLVPIAEYQGPHNLVDGPFHPRSIAINHTTGERWVAAGYAFRVDKFDPNDQYLFSIGDRETAGEALNDPMGIEVSQLTGDVFVRDTRHFLVKRFTSDGVFLNQWGGSIRVDITANGLIGFDDNAIAIDSQGNPWLATENLHYRGDPLALRLQKFLPDGTWLLGIPPLVDPNSSYSERKYGMDIDPTTDQIYVADAIPWRSWVRVHDSSGTILSEITGIPSPAGVAIHDDRMYVLSSSEHNVRRFRLGPGGTTATLERIFGGPGELNLMTESNLETDAGGTVFVADSASHFIRIYAPNGHLLRTIGGPGAGPGQFRLPRDVGIRRSTGEMYVLDSGRNRVQKFLLPLDNDQDSIDDVDDNCVYAANTDQSDLGGIGAGSPADGIGDACQCGDLDQDGSVTPADVVRYRAALADPVGAPLVGVELERCSVYGDRRACGLEDVIVLRRALDGVQLPGLDNACSP